MGWCGLGQLAQLPPYSLGMDPNGALDGAPTMHLADVTLPLLSYGLMVAPDYDGCSGGSSEGGSTPLRTTESSASGEGAEGADDAPPLGVGGIEVPPLPPPVVQPLSPRLAFILSNIGVDPIDCVRSCDQASYMPEGVFGDDTEAIRGSALEYILVPPIMKKVEVVSSSYHTGNGMCTIQ